MDHIALHRDHRDLLSRVERPGRYTGGEYGSVAKEGEGLLRVAVSYPDLYEIGMSNAAVRIIYGALNRLERVACERVFAPAPDYEAELRGRGLPLCSLETGRVLRTFDVVAFSIGFELTLTNLLAILDLGGVPLLARERGPGDPVVIAGGPATTNPVPLGAFVDAVMVGEAEGWIERTFARLADLKRGGAGRAALLEVLRGDPSIWFAGRVGVARRALWRGFATRPEHAAFPVPSIRVVQDHGTVEIMRGCPNSCRFCHAATFYRPCRRKSAEAIMAEVAEMVEAAGYREITLASLSSGDYPGIHELVRELNAAWGPRRVSFSLPSLRVDSLGLELLSAISEVRKSGLTFAVETPTPEWQEELRKRVPLGKTIEILREARARGWRSAKFYFMVGLPPAQGADEAEPVVEFLRAVRQGTGMELAVNIATFIPKPHTPWERAPQLGEQDALDRIMRVRHSLHGAGFKIGYHAPLLSLLEGIIARGDQRAGELVLEAYRRGARLDAWEEHFRPELWREVIAGAGWDVLGDTCRARAEGEPLPWDGIGLYLSQSDPSEDRPITQAPAPQASPGGPQGALPAHPRRPARMLFSFTKKRRAAWISHLDLMVVVERALARSGLEVSFTQGYNPKPRLEFASPLGLGFESEEEVGAIDLEDSPGPERFRQLLGQAMPEGLELVEAAEAAAPQPGKRRRSLMSLYWGADYRVEPEGRIVRLASGERGPRALAEEAGSRTAIVRTRTLARGAGGEPVSYFELARSSALS